MTDPVKMEFHVSRKARDIYHFDQTLFSLTGNVIFSNFHGARVFAQKMNEKKDLLNYPEQAVKAGQITAMGLIDEILHFVAALYREEVNGAAIGEALKRLYERLGEKAVDETLLRFTDEFPPSSVYRREITAEAYLDKEGDQTQNLEAALEELLLLWLANMNPAFAPFSELFDDAALRRETAYLRIVAELRTFFQEQQPFGPDEENLVDMLRRPALAVPHSLSGQLEYIREHWGFLLKGYIFRLLSSLDVLKEETKLPFSGPGAQEVYRYTGLETESERFSPDMDWMPRVVLLAKNIYVWLHQLSRKYGRSVTRLDEIPDEELDLLMQQGFSGLWLIGIWERSPASQKIKQLCGNPEAVSSAYSLYDYSVSADLGGEDAYIDLKERAARRGIRLASDMVPNHMGIDSKWVMEHPDWFVSIDYNPFPWYTYGGTNLSGDTGGAIHIEDHYYDRTDASVVFKRVDTYKGNEQYVYHGNDGTSMPWNDTAQLNYLNPEVREAMIRTIIHVARKSPIIRFDAAMTLTKKHYQRLWFPEPGTGGAIPTRAEHGLTKAEFDRLMPQEFWREVVDRIAAEAPDTLLLAEAFWLLEGYFVRTLGMHRVYNSAFMNMLRDEDNAKYRQVIKNTLEFDPEVLKRFVNFMNNPDERTAVDQFGKGDKYFGTCVMMVTTPGLPMFGHGQIEAYTEKYGMEYKRAYWDETPDQHAVRRHEHEIFPLIHRRHLFAGVENFLLYDFFTTSGTVNEDVFAYSNRCGNEKSLVVYHNRDGNSAGWIRASVAFLEKSGQDGRALVQRTLGEGLAVTPSDNGFTLFRDQISGLEFIRANMDLLKRGLYVELGSYGCQVFLDFREVMENQWGHYGQLTEYLNGRGVPDVDDALRELFLRPIHHSFKTLMESGLLAQFVEALEPSPEEAPRLLTDIMRNVAIERFRALVGEIGNHIGGQYDEEALVADIAGKLNSFLALPGSVAAKVDSQPPSNVEQAVGNRLFRATIVSWIFLHALGRIANSGPGADERSRSWIDEWHLGHVVGESITSLGFSSDEAARSIKVLKVFVTHQHWFLPESASSAYQLLRRLISDSEVQDFLGVNRYRDKLWFNKEAFEDLLLWMDATAHIAVTADTRSSETERAEVLDRCRTITGILRKAGEDSLCQVEKLLDSVGLSSSQQRP